MKYLIVSDPERGEFPVFCLAPQTHAELATAWRRDDSRKVVAAGFVDFGKYPATGTVETFGLSTSLDMGPRPQDARIIAGFYRATLAMAPKEKSSAPRQ